jgi:hypothetical protein
MCKIGKFCASGTSLHTYTRKATVQKEYNTGRGARSQGQKCTHASHGRLAPDSGTGVTYASDDSRAFIDGTGDRIHLTTMTQTPKPFNLEVFPKATRSEYERLGVPIYDLSVCIL